MNIKKTIKVSNKLISMPHNELNLDNYQNEFKNAFKTDFRVLPTPLNGPISLMAGGINTNAGLLYLHKDVVAGKRIILIGKGILFDSGGYNLKSKMKGMHTDMAGSAIAAAVTSYINSNNVVCLCPVTTNFIHNSKIIVGDKIKIGNKIVEVKNTDAEGRLVLAEALNYVNVTKNDIVITIATLTGACAYAVGGKATAIMSPNRELISKFLKASKKEGELAWELPLWEYLQKKFNKKTIPNILKDKCGTINAGMFLKQFAQYPKNWIHLDIAYSAFDKKGEKPNGKPIKTLINFVKGLL